MKNRYKLLLMSFFLFASASAFAQDPDTVKISELNAYSTPLVQNADVVNQALFGTNVYFEAIVVSYPKNSGLATPNRGDGSNEPGRIHLFVTDVNAIADGRDGMSMQLVVDGTQQRTLEGLDRGDVIGVTGATTSFGGGNIQFGATDVTFLGNIVLDSEYSDLAPLLDPVTIPLTDINQASETNPGTHTWVPENYSKYAYSYVKFEGLEIIDRTVDETGRPWFFLSDGETVIFTSDVSLRFRNDRGTYAYDPDNETNPISLGYNYRRLADSLDGAFTPPAPGSVVDLSGFLYPNTFDPVGFDESATTRTMRIVPWEDGVRWTADGDDESNRITEGIPNDLVVQGFAPILDNYTVTPDSGVSSTDQVVVSVDVLLPEEDYTLNSVEITYFSTTFAGVVSDTVTAAMTASGDTYTFTFDEYADFTTVDFDIVATAETPGEVSTKARQSGSFVVENPTQTAPVTFAPNPAGSYLNTVNVTLTSASESATIYYTVDGSEPTEASTEYTTGITLFETTTIKAAAKAGSLTLSLVSSATYTVTKELTEAATLDIIRTGTLGDTYEFTGEAVVTYARTSRNQKYVMDASGGLLIDDSPGTITSTYVIGDVISGLTGDLGAFSGVSQFLPAGDPGAPTKTAEVTPIEATLAQIDYSIHESALVKVSGVSFVETGTFEGGTDYALTDASLSEGITFAFRTNFSEAHYIGEAIPAGEFTLVAIVGGFNGTPQLIARDLADFMLGTFNEDELPTKFALEQNYPNPFNPSTSIRYSLESTIDVNLNVYDILGRKVATLVNGVQTAGLYNINFDASRLSSGTYIYRIEAGDFVSIKKMMLIK